MNPNAQETEECSSSHAELELFGVRLKEIRGEDPRPTFAQKIGVSKNTLARYETAERAADLAFIYRVCEIERVQPSWLISGVGPMRADTKHAEEYVQAQKIAPYGKIDQSFFNLAIQGFRWPDGELRAGDAEEFAAAVAAIYNRHILDPIELRELRMKSFQLNLQIAKHREWEEGLDATQKKVALPEQEFRRAKEAIAQDIEKLESERNTVLDEMSRIAERATKSQTNRRAAP
jgi:transcriptional regulator with XRE-family HTH domain